MEFVFNPKDYVWKRTEFERDKWETIVVLMKKDLRTKLGANPKAISNWMAYVTLHIGSITGHHWEQTYAEPPTRIHMKVEREAGTGHTKGDELVLAMVAMKLSDLGMPEKKNHGRRDRLR